MIHRIFSTLPTFKELTFHDGLNILLSDKSPNANDKQTRNGAGKSSFVETVHFLTGANVNADSMFRNVELVEHSFGMEFDLAGDLVTVERSGLEPTNVTIRDGNWSQWPYEPVPNEKTGKLELPNTEWRLVLGSKMFNLSSQKRTPKYSPTFRALFSYFARRQSAQAFLDPVRQSEDQVLWDQQVMITFLLGLDWSIPQSWQFVRDEEKTLKELRKAASAGAFGAVIGKVAELRTKLTIAEGRVEQLRAAIQEFQVLPQYREYEAEATSLTRNIGRLTDDNLVDSVLVADLESTIKVEDSQLNNDLEQLYREVGVILPEMVTRRFDEVRAFHNSVIDNRLSYLQGEIETARGRI